MKNLIRFIVQQEGHIHAPSIYFSILIAYLEQSKWDEALKILLLLENTKLFLEESKGLAYLSILWEFQDIKEIEQLSLYLSDC